MTGDCYQALTQILFGGRNKLSDPVGACTDIRTTESCIRNALRYCIGACCPFPDIIIEVPGCRTRSIDGVTIEIRLIADLKVEKLIMRDMFCYEFSFPGKLSP